VFLFPCGGIHVSNFYFSTNKKKIIIFLSHTHTFPPPAHVTYTKMQKGFLYFPFYSVKEGEGEVYKFCLALAKTTKLCVCVCGGAFFNGIFYHQGRATITFRGACFIYFQLKKKFDLIFLFPPFKLFFFSVPFVVVA